MPTPTLEGQIDVRSVAELSTLLQLPSGRNRRASTRLVSCGAGLVDQKPRRRRQRFGQVKLQSVRGQNGLRGHPEPAVERVRRLVHRPVLDVLLAWYQATGCAILVQQQPDRVGEPEVPGAQGTELQGALQAPGNGSFTGSASEPHPAMPISSESRRMNTGAGLFIGLMPLV